MISAIIPTIGRPSSLRRLLQALAVQTVRPDEVIIAHIGGLDFGEVPGELMVREVECGEPNAVRQRAEAIRQASGDLLLLLDDDVVPEPDCVRELVEPLWADSELVATTACFSNHRWPRPTRAWRAYLHGFHGVRKDEEVQGRVLGPLLRFGYFDGKPDLIRPMEWLGAGNSCVRREAFEAVGGFSDFFLHRSTMHEDVDLGLRLGRMGRIGLCRRALMAHEHAPGGRLDQTSVAEDDVFNRFQVLHQTVGLSPEAALRQARIYVRVEMLGHVCGKGLWKSPGLFMARLRGWGKALRRIEGKA